MPAASPQQAQRTGVRKDGASPARNMVSTFSRRAQTTGTLQPWERETVQMPEVQRKATLAQIYFLNHYFDSLRYISDRRARLAAFERRMRERGYVAPEAQMEHTMQSLSLGQREPPTPAARSSISEAEYQRARAKHMAEERELLRRRRTKLRSLIHI